MTNTSADTPVDTGASRSKGRTEFENLDKEDLRSLLNEIEVLKVNNENMRAKLLEASMMNNSYIEEISKLKKQVEHLTTPPLFIASVMEIEDNMILIR
ncbi:MAG TPA: peptidase, partial [Methanomethylovorans sp.]|nr:peptidase [Methanomethylovorans sp.]